MAYRIGLDAGSKTIKIVVVDDEGKIVHSLYRRHKAEIRITLQELLHELSWLYGDLYGPVAVTGSAGIAVAQLLGLPFIQEVSATTKAVEETLPQADVIIELGGEDAKVVYLGPNMEQRMNATCAGGTGGFIDTIAFMLGVQTSEMNSLALGANRIYPIASRCAVFAQTDVRPLLNSGAKKSDIAASVLDAVVRQTLGGLACGRAIQGTVVFLGGPLEHIPELVRRFRKALGLSKETGIKPADAHLFTALGAALAASGFQGNVMSLKVLERRVANAPDPQDDLEHMPPLFKNRKELEEFAQRHAGCSMPRSDLYSYRGSCYLGLDAGSTTVKMALVDEEGKLLYSDYQPVEGDSLACASKMVGNMYRRLPRNPATKEPYVSIVSSCVTGYGEELLKEAFKMSGGVVETIAHARAAQAFCPDASFVLDIGGQDMKALWIQEGRIVDAVLNEACFSGCGSFIEGTAHSLRSTPEAFSQAALKSTSPIDLGTKCTVFMTSRVRHAQKIGASLADIAAGIAYSVVKNALFRIIGQERLGKLGKVVVQGGTFKSDAVLRAFELVGGIQAVRPDTAHLMGAIGSALVARERHGQGASGERGFISPEELASLHPVNNRVTCLGCENSCALTVVSFGDGRSFVSGNRCPRGAIQGKAQQDRSDFSARMLPPNTVAAQQELLSAFGCCSGKGSRSQVRIGVMNALRLYECLPFWHTLCRSLGFTVMVPKGPVSGSVQASSSESIPSESVCQAAKVSHQRLYQLREKGAHFVLMPGFTRYSSCIVSCLYSQVLSSSAPILKEEGFSLLNPVLEARRPKGILASSHDRSLLLATFNDALASHGLEADITMEELDAALACSLAAQESFEAAMGREAESALAWVHSKEGRRGVVLCGRPYHMDPQLLGGIDKTLSELGVAVFSTLGLPLEKVSAPQGWPHSKHHLGVSRFVVENSSLELVFLESFGCGYDAVSLEMVQELLRGCHRPFTALKIDGMSDTAHVRIRLRTLVESMENREDSQRGSDLFHQALDSLQQKTQVSTGVTAQEASSPLPGVGLLMSPNRSGAAFNLVGSSSFDSYAKALVDKRRPRPLQQDPDPTCIHQPGFQSLTHTPVHRDPRRHDLRNVMCRPLDQGDWELARKEVCSGCCSTVMALTARCIRQAKDNPFLDSLDVPKVCHGCQLDALPFMVTKALGRPLAINWVPLEEFGVFRQSPCPSGDDRIKVGILGNALMCFSPFLNDGVEQLLEELGCCCVMPRLENLSHEDVGFSQQMALFQQQGVEQVLYLQSFGCLKGHVQVKGALADMAHQFPQMPITVIDYDPESSKLNRENRIRLAVDSARRRRPTAPLPQDNLPGPFGWVGEAAGRLAQASEKLAVGEDPFLSEDGAVALSYLLEEGIYAGRPFESGQELRCALERDLVCKEEKLACVQREADLLRKALEALD